MKSNSMKNKPWLKYLLFPIPFIIGFIGYLPVFDYNILSAAFSAIRLFAFQLDTDEITIPIEIARWTAPIAAAGAVAAAVHSAKYLRWRIYSLFKPGYAVYGESEYAKAIVKGLGKEAYLLEEKKPVKCKNHIIMLESDRESLSFYGDVRSKNKNSLIFMRLSKIFRDCTEDESLRVFNMEENCARQYWNEHYVLDAKEKIAIIGFGALGEAILHFGLLTNVVDPEQKIEYHIFGDHKRFKALHTELGEIEDKIVFHENDWFMNLGILKGCGRIILCDSPSENLVVLGELFKAIIIPNVHVYVTSAKLLDRFFKQVNIKPFGITDELCKRKVILQESLFKEAIKLHNVFVEKYKDAKNAKPWGELNTFLRYSNISAADHIPVKKRLVQDIEDIDILAEIEHIRWSRYHYLNNWKYAEERDDENRLHKDLKPYAELDENTKQKDKSAYNGII